VRGSRASDRRSPLKQQPLRVPGESLAEERNRILYDRVLPYAILAIFLILYAGLQWWESFTKSPPQPSVATFFAVCAVVYATYRTLKVRPQLLALRLGMKGEKVVGQLLDAHNGADWHVFHDIPGRGFNVDHVLVSPQGIYAIETKTFSKPTKGRAVVAYDGDKVVVDGFEPDRNPVVQARAGRDWIGDLLFEATGMQYPVRGVVIFPGWFVESPKGGNRPDVWVLNEKAFIKYVEKEPAKVKKEYVALAKSRLINYITR
jgi:hypothetical protein